MEPDGAGEMAVRMYALAVQVYGLYQEAEWTRRQCFPQTATGEELDKHAFLRGLTRNEAVRAAGTLRFSVGTAAQTDLPIPQGTVCMTAGLVTFETTREAVLPAGKLSVDVPAQAVLPGSGGNTPAGTIRTMAVAPTGVAACTNPAAFTGGRETEEDEELRARILASYQRLPNGTNAAYYEQEATALEGVAAANVLPKNRGLGTVDIYIAADGGLPSQELLEEVQDALARSLVDCVLVLPQGFGQELLDAARTGDDLPNVQATYGTDVQTGVLAAQEASQWVSLAGSAAILEPDAGAFCERAKKHELLLVPSDSFGIGGYVRVAYCVQTDMIERALPAFHALAEEYKKGK